MPPPSVLTAGDVLPRTASYTENDLVKDGSDTNPAWPWNNVAPFGAQMVFSPSWAGTGSGADDLAYCMWEFVISGYDRNPQVRYTWVGQPVDPSEVWIGLADWVHDNWDWYAGQADGKLTLPSLDPYFNFGDKLALVIVRTGTTESTLSKVRIGGVPPFAELSTSATRGITPLQVDFDGSGSLDDDGTIVKYEWDFDGDGSFEVDSGDDPTQSHSYSSSTQTIATMRVTDNDGLTSTDGVSIVALEPGAHTWGGSETENTLDFAITSSHIYCVGYSGTYVGSNNESLVLLKYKLTGELEWAKAFRGTSSEIGMAVTVNSDGNVIVAGRSHSWGAGGIDMLVQMWSPEGSLLWSKVYGGSGTEQAYAIATDGPDIYVAGYTSTPAFSAGEEDALFVRLDEYGTVQWATAWGGENQEFARDIKRVPSLGGLHSFRATGDTSSFGEGKSDVIYLTLTGQGDISEEFTWGDSDDQVGNAIRLGYLGADPYICGYTEPGLYKKVLLLEFSLGDTFTRKYWDRAGIHEANDLVYASGNFYLVGNYKSEPAAIWNGFYMVISDSSWSMHSNQYANPSLGVTFEKLGLFGNGQGMFICGSMDDADGSITDTFNDPAGEAPDVVWQMASGTLTSCAIATAATSGAGIDTITEAVIDSGGGSKDAAIVFLDLN